MGEVVARRVWTGTEGQTDRPACGPLPSACCECKVGGQPVNGFTIWKCCRCGDEEWL